MKTISIDTLLKTLLFTLILFPIESKADLLCGRIKISKGKPTFKTTITKNAKCPKGAGLILKTNSTLSPDLEVSSISGLQGPEGPQGPQGPQGTAGAPGTTNAIFSSEFGPNFNGGSAYQSTMLFGINNISFTIRVPELTQEVLNKGIVYVVANLAGYNGSVWPAGTRAHLPYTVTYVQSGPQVDTWQFQATPGQIKIIFNNNNNIYTGTGISGEHRFRYIIIPKQ